ncbi:alpha/beta-hydrolase [Bimuria novae-zelandiae CBS 107.79]|uniref:Alpha/beta-hydrolase n=1 Tax=Bimuria novae-zelandiae CBS 107.79 TaxID=1447943 RepID=A0A6A5VC53_9PLEO|nr:alpha/beta-hydrolase [Bimuria novae-zelandiae CBS 107.79]
MAATNNPLEGTSADHPTISTQTHTIAGILTHVHGLTELPPSTSTVTCLWLMHPRLQTAQKMTPIAASIISTWNARIASNRAGLIAVSFDQRNHGSRLVDALHNEAWNKGNPRHAQDMFGCIHGTAQDTSQIMDHLESYILSSKDSPSITRHFVLGISLGGHAAWHCVLAEPRITAAVVGIGCPDYARLMADRARLSKLPSYTESTPPGAGFLGSRDFPPKLVEAVAKYDPAGLLLPGQFNPAGPDAEVGKAAMDRMKVLIRERLQGKHILNLSGKIDKLVPYSAGEAFLKVFKRALEEESGLDVEFEDVLFDGVGHTFPQAMVEKSADWICGLLSVEDGRVTSKI